MSKKQTVDKFYVSPADRLLESLAETYPLSASQKAETEHHKQVFQWRDNPRPKVSIDDIWSDFNE